MSNNNNLNNVDNFENNFDIEIKRHSFAHLMASAVKQMFPEAQFGVGPTVENGCYYDFILPRTLIPEDLPLIEKKIKELLKRKLVFKVQEVSMQEAVLIFEKLNQPLKLELLEDLAKKGTTKLSEEEADVFGIAGFPNDSEIPLINSESNIPPTPLERGAKEGTRLFFALNSIGKRPFSFSSIKYDNRLSERAKDLRNECTKAEEIFWDLIRKDDVLGRLTWNRQKPVGGFIADFYCRELNLIIELDGSSHIGKEGYDEGRDNFIKSQFLEILRFKNDEIVSKPKEILNKIIKWSKEKSPFSSLKSSGVVAPLSRGVGGMFEEAKDEDKFSTLEKVRRMFEEKDFVPKITIYRLEDEKTGEDLFVDLCRGPHVEASRDLRGLGFKLDKFSGSYWRGDQERDIQMQRIYALVFETKDELKEFEEARKLARERDHRKLGQELEIFMVSDEVGTGLPLYLPNGGAIRQLLEKYCYQEAKKSGYQYVYTPHIGKEDLFAKSGHLAHYADGMYAPIDMVNLKGEGADESGKTEKFYLKPMNCPMHHQIYLNKPKSYRDLPYRLYEYGTVYRYEDSGTLSGMIRVRGFTQNDAHVYCRTNQLKEVIGEAINRFTKAYEDIGIKDYKIRFSLPDFVNDKEKFGEETEEWVNSVLAMRQALDDLGVDYYDAVGEAAFYGPKIDIQVKNVNGKEDSLSTIQVDYSIAPKFGITYKNEEGEEEVPAIIHMALMGSVDRFMAFMLEMTGGRLPLWLAPTQVKILTVNNEEETLNYVSKIREALDEVVLMKPLKYNEIRYEVDDRSESLGKKIREATLQKTPVILIVGPKDIEAGEVSVRTQKGEEKVSLGELEGFIKSLQN